MQENTNKSFNALNTGNLFKNNYNSSIYFHETCRTCLIRVMKNLPTDFMNSIETYTKEIVIRNSLYLCCPELNLHITLMTILCENCSERVNAINGFICKYKKEPNEHITFTSTQNRHLFERCCFAGKAELKTNEIEFINKENSSNAFKNSNCNSSQVQRLDCRLIDGEKSYKSSEYDYKIETVTEPFKYSLCSDSSTSEMNFKQIHIYIPEISNKLSQFDGSDVQLDSNEKQNNFESTNILFQCFQCNYSFRHKNSLRKHIHTHVKEKPFKCFLCNFTSRYRSSLEFHLTTHSEDKPFKCLHCSSSFAHPNTLSNHMYIHTREKPFKCLQCNSCFSNKYYLIIHTRLHTKDKQFRCLHCDYSSANKYYLQRHVRVHKEEKPYKCSHCDSSFRQKKNLDIHVRSHTGEKPYKCSFCNSNFSRKTVLRRHIRGHTGEKPFKCLHCNSNFTQNSSLKHHMRIHTEKKLYKCSQCDFSSIQLGNLITHIRTHPNLD